MIWTIRYEMRDGSTPWALTSCFVDVHPVKFVAQLRSEFPAIETNLVSYQELGDCGIEVWNYAKWCIENNGGEFYRWNDYLEERP